MFPIIGTLLKKFITTGKKPLEKRENVCRLFDNNKCCFPLAEKWNKRKNLFLT